MTTALHLYSYSSPYNCIALPLASGRTVSVASLKGSRSAAIDAFIRFMSDNKAVIRKKAAAQQMHQLDDILEPYDRLIEITILGEKKLVPENNSILRCLQYLDVEKISEADLCWNGECLDCQVWIKNGQKEKALISCRTNATEGMEILRISEPLS